MEYNLDSLKKLMVGKLLGFYDSWDSRSVSIVVTEVHDCEKEVRCTGMMSNGSAADVYVWKDKLDKLLQTGAAMFYDQIKGCTLLKRWTLKEAPVASYPL